MRAFVFPGQGAQTIGMGKALADAYPSAKAVFDEVDDALGEKLSSLIWDGQIEELTLTANAQPALMATSMAAMRALEAEGVTIGAATYVAGHSLGEYSALAATGALSIADTARLLRTRGSFAGVPRRLTTPCPKAKTSSPPTSASVRTRAPTLMCTLLCPVPPTSACIGPAAPAA